MALEASTAGSRATRTSRPRARTLAVLAALGGIASLAAACGGGPAAGVASLGSTTTTTSTNAPAATGAAASGSRAGTLYAAAVRFASCMRSHGVANFPEPSISSSGNGVKIQIAAGASGVNPASRKFAAASATCRKYLPAGGPQGAPITPAQQADYLKAANCMRAHGIAGFPDPVFSNSRVSFPIPSTMSTTSTQFLRARAVCELLIPAGLPYSKQAEGGG